MRRNVACLVVVLCMAGLVLAQKEKDKSKDSKDKTKAKIVMIDVKKKMLTVEIDGKKKELMVAKETKFVGPKGGKRDIKDKALKAGATIWVVIDKDGKLKEVHIPAKEKPKDKDKK
jgi:hypothetical protein